MIRTLLAPALLQQSDRLERAVLGGRRPVYAPERMFGKDKATPIRWGYGFAIGRIQKRLRLPALLFGPLLAAGELIALPALGATPPLRKWKPKEIGLLFAHATLFAVANGS